ncbi:13538_t:CDS:2 [Entrophospora sp. SA101]|nr:13538_t:CDS:2 [Entrophospora sp. SA101]
MLQNKGKKPKLARNYELSIGERICPKCYNTCIAYDSYDRYKRKSENALYKIRKQIEIDANTDMSNFSLQKLQNFIQLSTLRKKNKIINDPDEFVKMVKERDQNSKVLSVIDI